VLASPLVTIVGYSGDLGKIRQEALTGKQTHKTRESANDALSSLPIESSPGEALFLPILNKLFCRLMQQATLSDRKNSTTFQQEPEGRTKPLDGQILSKYVDLTEEHLEGQRRVAYESLSTMSSRGRSVEVPECQLPTLDRAPPSFEYVQG